MCIPNLWIRLRLPARVARKASHLVCALPRVERTDRQSSNVRRERPRQVGASRAVIVGAANDCPFDWFCQTSGGRQTTSGCRLVIVVIVVIDKQLFDVVAINPVILSVCLKLFELVELVELAECDPGGHADGIVPGQWQGKRCGRSCRAAAALARRDRAPKSPYGTPSADRAHLESVSDRRFFQRGACGHRSPTAAQLGRAVAASGHWQTDGAAPRSRNHCARGSALRKARHSCIFSFEFGDGKR